MNAYIARHAEARSTQEDPDRPLTRHGREQASRVAACLGRIPGVSVPVIYHSDKRRARETAEIFAGILRPPRGIEVQSGLRPADDASFWLERLTAIDEDVMLVSHLPFVSDLVAGMLSGGLSGGRIAFAPAGVACVHRSADGWYLRWLIDPDLASAARDRGMGGRG